MNLPSVDLSTTVSGIFFPSPLLTASGTCGYGETFSRHDFPYLGGIVTKGISLLSRAGNPPPRIQETSCGLLNAIGLENIGVNAFIEQIIPELSNREIPVIVNIFGETVKDICEVALRLSSYHCIRAFELNVSCPNVASGGIAFGKDRHLLKEIIQSIKKALEKPLWVKLTPNVTDIADFARTAEDAGSDVLTIANSYVGLAVDVEKEDFLLGNITGGLTGPAIKPLTQYAVWKVVNAVDIPVIASGGVSSAHDALEYLLLGAKAVQIGSSAMVSPSIFTTVGEAMVRFLDRKNIHSMRHWIGRLQA